MQRLTITLVALAAFGCRVPPGTNVQTSGVGVHLSPFGASPAAPKVSVGSIAHSYSTPAPLDAGPTLNRVQIAAAGISDHTATIAQGGVGRELDFARQCAPGTV